MTNSDAPELPTYERRGLARPNQLWVLNRAGWLQLRPDPAPELAIANAKADEAIRMSMSLDEEAEA